MASASSTLNYYRIESITHNGATICEDALGFDAQETVEFAENTPGTRISPASALQKYSLSATAKSAQFALPVVRGTIGSLVVTMTPYSRGTGKAVTYTKMRAGAVGDDMNSAPFSRKQEFRYDAGDTEDIAPISAAA